MDSRALSEHFQSASEDLPEYVKCANLVLESTQIGIHGKQATRRLKVNQVSGCSHMN